MTWSIRFGMTPEELVDLWYSFAECPLVIPPYDEPRSTFSASDYVRQRAPIMCASVPVVLPRTAS